MDQTFRDYLGEFFSERGIANMTVSCDNDENSDEDGLTWRDQDGCVIADIPDWLREGVVAMASTSIERLGAQIDAHMAAHPEDYEDADE